jgi:hypothetical protein
MVSNITGRASAIGRKGVVMPSTDGRLAQELDGSLSGDSSTLLYSHFDQPRRKSDWLACACSPDAAGIRHHDIYVSLSESS